MSDPEKTEPIMLAATRLVESRDGQKFKRTELFKGPSTYIFDPSWQKHVCNFWIDKKVIFRHTYDNRMKVRYSFNNTNENMEYLMSVNSAKSAHQVIDQALTLARELRNEKDRERRAEEKYGRTPPSPQMTLDVSTDNPEPVESAVDRVSASILKLTFCSSEAIIDIRDNVLQSIIDTLAGINKRLDNIENSLSERLSDIESALPDRSLENDAINPLAY